MYVIFRTHCSLYQCALFWTSKLFVPEFIQKLLQGFAIIYNFVHSSVAQTLLLGFFLKKGLVLIWIRLGGWWISPRASIIIMTWKGHNCFDFFDQFAGLASQSHCSHLKIFMSTEVTSFLVILEIVRESNGPSVLRFYFEHNDCLGEEWEGLWNDLFHG